MASPVSSLKIKVFSGLLWRFAEKAGANLVRFVVSIILARLLAPELFGIFVIVTVFTGFIELFVESGFGKSLIQKEDADNIDFSTVFYFTTAISVVLYVLLYFAAPFIADFYEYTQIASILRVKGLSLFLCGINIAQTAYASRNMLFKRFFWATTGAVMVSSIVALVVAYAGYGIWALVAQSLVGAVTGTIILFFTLAWRPTLAFSWQRMKSLYSFGWKILFSSVIYRVYRELRALVIGRLYSPVDLAFFSRGKSFPALISDNFTKVTGSVFFPAISRKQKSTETVKEMMRLSMSATSYLIWPLMVGLAVIAEPLVLLLLTEKWIEAVPFLQIACYYSALTPIQEANIQAINAMGRSDITLKLRIIKTVAGIAILLLVMSYGVLAIALSTILTSTVFLIINIIPNAKLINYRLSEQMVDILPYVGMSALMAAIIHHFRLLQISDILIIIIQITLGGGIYLLLSIIFKVKAFQFILGTCKQFLTRK